MLIKPVARAAITALALLAAPATSHAATQTASLAVSVTVAPHCRIGATANRSTGEHGATALAVTCETTTPFNVTYGDPAAPQPTVTVGPSDPAGGRIAATITF